MNFRSIIPLWLLTACVASAASAPQHDEAWFRKNIQPILSEHCYKCHSHAGDKIKGGLVVDSREGLLAGGDSGEAIVPGDPEKSLFITAIRYEDEDLQMPPKGKKLSDEQIAVLTEWVKAGAPWPTDPGAQKLTSRPKGKITDEDRQWWSFRPIAHAVPPQVEDGAWSRNEIDRFVFAKLRSENLEPAPRATRAELIRRVSFDITGLPPSPEDIRAFVADPSPDAYERLVDRLLASPQYGEHWARHWLDLVRYAESDGYRIDDYRPNAWRYRDYVIRAMNEDKPYDRFVAEQLAGDEIAPDDLDARVATGYLRHWVYEYNNRDAVTQWTTILNDITDVTADVFMGLGVGCARCHDHKFDPILQKDYFRLQAFFAPILPRDDQKVATAEQHREYEEKLKLWEEKTADLRSQIAAIEAPHKQRAAEDAINKFPPETQALIRKPIAERAPYEHQIAELAYRQVLYEFNRLINKMRGADKEKLVGLYKQLSAFDKDKPAPLPVAFSASDVGPVAPPVTIPKRPKESEIQPGFLTLLDEKPAVIPAGLKNSTGRRKALADWLTNPENPLTSRVMVNRVWQYHFGRGLVGTSSDFGKIGDQPTHPELLDWMARRFVRDGWRLKSLHRLILLSSTYQQSVGHPKAAEYKLKDPENKLMWRGNTRRLSAEQIRDAVLAATGELKLDAPGGPSVDWAQPRRSIYTKVVRNTRDPLLDVFDAPEGFSSMSQRNTTTTPTQSLLMINSNWSLQRAKAFAQRLQRDRSSSGDESLLTDAAMLTFGREPAPAELEAMQRFVAQQASLAGGRKADLKAAPFVSDKMPFREGRAALLIPKSAQERLEIPQGPKMPGDNFTVEAFIKLNSIYEDGQVRTVAAHWDGKRGHPGWALGVTSTKSRYKPQTLVLMLAGDQPYSDKDPMEPVFSGLHIDLGKPYFIAVSVDLDDTTEKGITFYAKDLSNDDEPMQVAQIPHKTVSGIRSQSSLWVGGRGGDGAGHLFDGVVDDLRISSIPLPQEQLILTRDGVNEHTVGYWKFENDPGPYKDSSKRTGDIAARQVEGSRVEPKQAALADFCQVLLNSNEFLYVD